MDGWLPSTKWPWVSFCTSLETARLLWNCPWDDGIWLIFKHHLLRNVKGIFPLINLTHLYLFQVFIKGSNKILNYFPLKFIFLLMRSHILLKHTHINCLVYKTNWVFLCIQKKLIPIFLLRFNQNILRTKSSINNDHFIYLMSLHLLFLHCIHKDINIVLRKSRR